MSTAACAVTGMTLYKIWHTCWVCQFYLYKTVYKHTMPILNFMSLPMLLCHSIVSLIVLLVCLSYPESTSICGSIIYKYPSAVGCDTDTWQRSHSFISCVILLRHRMRQIFCQYSIIVFLSLTIHRSSCGCSRRSCRQRVGLIIFWCPNASGDPK